MKRTTTTIALCAAITSMGPCRSSDADVSGWWQNNSNFSWSVSGMPDFDQSRLSTTGIFGLPDGGSVHCVPTSSMNLFAYAAAHGYPWIDPGNNNWQDGSTQTYNASTLTLLALGLEMNTGLPGGTNNTGWYNGTRDWLPASQFDVWHQVAFSGLPTNTREMAKLSLNGALVNFCYGRWNHDGYTLTSRTSGHCVTPTSVEADGQLVSSTLKYRDPASGGSSFSQSTFSTASADMTDLFWNFDGSGYLMSTFDVGQTLSSAKYNVIDTIHAIFPKQGLTETPSGFSLYTPAALGALLEQQVDFPSPGPISVLRQSPNRTWIAAVTRVPDLDRYCLYAMDPLIGEFVGIADILDPKGMVFGRRGELNVLDGRVIKQFDLNAEEPLVAVLPMPGEVLGDDICYDDSTDEIVVVASNPRVIYRFDRKLDGLRGSDSFPFVSHDGPLMAAMNPADGTLFIGTRGGEVRQLRRNPFHNRLEYGLSYGGPNAQPISDVSFDDRGHAFLTRDGEIVELMFDAEGVGREVEGLFSGLPAGETFQVSRSRTNFDPEVLPGRGWSLSTPLDELRIVDEVPDCDADYNDDGVGDIRDLLEYLVDYFAGDSNANRDDQRVIDIRDLLDFLTVWFNGCPGA